MRKFSLWFKFVVRGRLSNARIVSVTRFDNVGLLSVWECERELITASFPFIGSFFFDVINCQCRAAARIKRSSAHNWHIFLYFEWEAKKRDQSMCSWAVIEHQQSKIKTTTQHKREQTFDSDMSKLISHSKFYFVKPRPYDSMDRRVAKSRTEIITVNLQ